MGQVRNSYFFIIFKIPQLKKYKEINILPTIVILKGSGVGVRTAPRITLPSTAYLHFFIKIFEFTNPMLARAKIIIGRRKAHPHSAIINKVNET